MFFHLCSPVKTIKIHLPFRQIFFWNPDNIKKPWQSSHLLSFCNYLQSSTRKYDQKFVSTSVCLHEQSTKTVRNCFKERLLDVDFDFFLMIFFSKYIRASESTFDWLKRRLFHWPGVQHFCSGAFLYDHPTFYYH